MRDGGTWTQYKQTWTSFEAFSLFWGDTNSLQLLTCSSGNKYYKDLVYQVLTCSSGKKYYKDLDKKRDHGRSGKGL